MMSRSEKTVVITAAVLVILGGVLAVLLLTKPKAAENTDPPSITDDDGSNTYAIDRSADEVTSVTIKNDGGEYTFVRKKHTVTTVDEYGQPTLQDELYWTSDDLKGVLQSDSAVRNFISDLASLPINSAVEDNAEDLEKYGLENPASSAFLKFDDGTSAEMRFGIRNPADDSGVYFTMDGSRNVKLVNYYSVMEAFSDVKQFVRLTLSESYDSSKPLQMLKITRPDLAAPLEIRLISDNVEQSEDANTHRFICSLCVHDCPFTSATNPHTATS